MIGRAVRILLWSAVALAATAGNVLVAGFAAVTQGAALAPLDPTLDTVVWTVCWAVTLLALTVLGVVVHRFCTKGLAPRRTRAFAVLLVVSSGFFATWALSAAFWAYGRGYGAYVERTMELTGYREELVTWPGVPGPVGIRIQFDLGFRREVPRTFEVPAIWMTPEVVDVRATVRPGGYGAVSLVPRGTRAVSARYLDHQAQIFYRRVFDTGTDLHFDYVLYPDALWDFDLAGEVVRPAVPPKARSRSARRPGPAPERICTQRTLFEPGPERCRRSGLFRRTCTRDPVPVAGDPVVSEGSDLTASWFFWYRDNRVVVDASDVLTRAVRTHGRLQGDAELWSELHRSLSGESLLDAGWGACAPDDRPLEPENVELTCYCR